MYISVKIKTHKQRIFHNTSKQHVVMQIECVVNVESLQKQFHY